MGQTHPIVVLAQRRDYRQSVQPDGAIDYKEDATAQILYCLQKCNQVFP